MKKEKKKTNIFTLTNIIIGVIMVIAMFLPIIGDVVIITGIYAFLCAIGAIMGIIGTKKIKSEKDFDHKTINKVFMIINIVICILMLSSCASYSALKNVEFADQVACPRVNECVKNKDGKTSNCSYMGIDITCSNSVLIKSQYK